MLGMVASLGVESPLRIRTGEERIEEPFLLMTYTDGYGRAPRIVEDFLKRNGKYLRGVIVSGDKAYGEYYCLAGKKIAEEHGVPNLYSFENGGNDDDVAAIKGIIKGMP